MGSCLSSNKNITQQESLKSTKDSKPTVTADVALKSQWSASQPLSSFQSSGSKEESFFDSKPWLDSDCEDDYFSVNGDFAPSQGSSPVHPSLSKGTSRVNKSLSDGKISSPVPEPSQVDKKKKLVELFRESIRDNQNLDEQKASGEQNMPNSDKDTLNQPAESANGTASHSSSVVYGENTSNGVSSGATENSTRQHLAQSANGTSSGTSSVSYGGRTANGASSSEKEKPIRSTQYCLPGFASCKC